MKRFKPILSVCKRCMAETRVPIHASYETSDPVLWNDKDDERWKEGKVLCPQAGGACKPMRQFCLRHKEADAVNDGKVYVWDEKSN